MPRKVSLAADATRVAATATAATGAIAAAIATTADLAATLATAVRPTLCQVRRCRLER